MLRRLLILCGLLVLAGCSATPGPQIVPSTRPAVTATLPSPVPAGYGSPCARVVRLGAGWMDLVVRLGESETLDLTARPEVEAMITDLAAVNPLLPAQVQLWVPNLVDPMVKVRGLILTGVAGTVEFGPGRDAVAAIISLCGPYLTPAASHG